MISTLIGISIPFICKGILVTRPKGHDRPPCMLIIVIVKADSICHFNCCRKDLDITLPADPESKIKYISLLLTVALQ